MSTFGNHKFEALGNTGSLYTFFFFKKRREMFPLILNRTLTLASCTFFLGYPSLRGFPSYLESFGSSAASFQLSTLTLRDGTCFSLSDQAHLLSP